MCLVQGLKHPGEAFAIIRSAQADDHLRQIRVVQSFVGHIEGFLAGGLEFFDRWGR